MANRSAAEAWADTFGDADTSTARAAADRALTEGPAMEFPDTATGSKTMSGDGSAQQAWFLEHSNVGDLARRISYDEPSQEAFLEWVMGRFMSGQQYGGFSHMSPRDQQITRILDKWADQSVIRDPVIVRRRSTTELLGLGKVRRLTLEQLQALEGKTVVSRGHMSTTAASQGLTITGDESSKPVEYKMRIPGGAKGAGMWIGDTRIQSYWGSQQLEFMANRDTAWRVGKTTYDGRRGVYVVELTFAGRRPHDYS